MHQTSWQFGALVGPAVGHVGIHELSGDVFSFLVEKTEDDLHEGAATEGEFAAYEKGVMQEQSHL